VLARHGRRPAHLRAARRELEGEARELDGSRDGKPDLLDGVRGLNGGVGERLLVGVDGRRPDALRREALEPLRRGALADGRLEEAGDRRSRGGCGTVRPTLGPISGFMSPVR